MKPFDLEAAKAGKPLVTRDGRKVTDFKHFETMAGNEVCIAVFDGGEYEWYKKNGRYLLHDEHRNDLFMAPEEVTVWVNVYKSQSNSTGFKAGEYTYESKEKAEQRKANENYIGVFPLTVKL